jgi:hypothetical protein
MSLHISESFFKGCCGPCSSLNMLVVVSFRIVIVSFCIVVVLLYGSCCSMVLVVGGGVVGICSIV